MDSQAYQWAMMRECWLELGTYAPTPASDLLRKAIEATAPTYVPDLDNGESHGDSGSVMFADGSELKWDWDEGNFELPSGQSLSYPWSHEDPLYWKHTQTPTLS